MKSQPEFSLGISGSEVSRENAEQICYSEATEISYMGCRSDPMKVTVTDYAAQFQLN
jgi:hypothetical protein